MPTAEEEWSLNHWTTREFLIAHFLLEEFLKLRVLNDKSALMKEKKEKAEESNENNLFTASFLFFNKC